MCGFDTRQISLSDDSIPRVSPILAINPLNWPTLSRVLVLLLLLLLRLLRLLIALQFLLPIFWSIWPSLIWGLPQRLLREFSLGIIARGWIFFDPISAVLDSPANPSAFLFSPFFSFFYSDAAGAPLTSFPHGLLWLLRLDAISSVDTGPWCKSRPLLLHFLIGFVRNMLFPSPAFW